VSSTNTERTSIQNRQCIQSGDPGKENQRDQRRSRPAQEGKSRPVPRLSHSGVVAEPHSPRRPAAKGQKTKVRPRLPLPSSLERAIPNKETDRDAAPDKRVVDRETQDAG
jgi:hypothetical protein